MHTDSPAGVPASGGSLVSIIIPAYNAAPWIRDTVESALLQTWRSLEVIVVDDASSDGTAAVVESIADSRLAVLRQPHAGAAAARNRGMRHARGHLLQFLDADDLLAPEKIALQVEALARAPSGSIASCAWARFSDDPASAVFSAEPVWTQSDPVQWLIESLGGGGMMQPAAWLTPAAVASEAGLWDESLSLHDDGEFFSRVLLASSRNVFVPAARVYYRDVPGSLSRRRNRAAMVSALAVCAARHRQLLAARDDTSARRALATQYAQFAYEFGTEAPDLAASALEAISALGARPARHVGGGAFRSLAGLVGFKAAQRLRVAVARFSG